MSEVPNIELDDPDRLRGRALLDEVFANDHSNDSADAVLAQALKDARAEGAEEGFARGYEAARANAEEDQL